MPPKGASTAINPVRLQSVKKLKLRSTAQQAAASPCLGPMSAVLNCWASASHHAASGHSFNCTGLEQALRECMDFSRRNTTNKNDFNYHLSRLYPKIRGPRKKGN